MKTKIVQIKRADNTSNEVMLYQNETTGKWFHDKEKALDVFHTVVMESDDKKSRIIRQYYCECTIDYTREKIRKMVNAGQIDQLYDTIVNEILQHR